MNVESYRRRTTIEQKQVITTEVKFGDGGFEGECLAGDLQALDA